MFRGYGIRQQGVPQRELSNKGGSAVSIPPIQTFAELQTHLRHRARQGCLEEDEGVLLGAKEMTIYKENVHLIPAKKQTKFILESTGISG